jgi:hypothetical protein
MITTHKRAAATLVVAVALVLFLVGAAAFGRASGPSDRANDAYSQRLTQHAQQLQAEARSERARAAWAARLTGIAELEGKSPANGAPGMSDRAIKAWSDRLTGLAEYLASK